MNYQKMPKTNDELSILGFGCMRLPSKGMNVNEEEAIKQIRYAADKGINYFDTAWPYHNGASEVVLGKALKDGYREKVHIATKLPHWLCKSRDDMECYLNEQLKRLDVDVIDYYLIHMLDGDSWEKNKELGIIEFMNDALKSKKINHIGFSFHGMKDDFRKIIDDYDWEFCQIQFNILDETAQAGIEGLNYAWSKKIGVIIMEPLRGGSLANQLPKDVENIYKIENSERSNVDWALRWVWNHPGVITVLSGMNTMDQINENMEIATSSGWNKMTESELKTVKKAAETFKSIQKVPCTACQYCMPCPMGVNIPMAFSLYNNKYLFKQGFMSRAMYLLQLGGIQEGRQMGLASQCVNCGLCMKHCPQHIEIPKELKKVEKEFEGFFTRPIKLMMKIAMNSGKRKKK